MSIKFQIKRIEGGLAYGDLTWSEKGLKTGAFSGPYGRGELPKGLYRAYRSKLLNKDGQPGYCDSLQNCWFQVLDPQFSTARDNLGIHPDGNLTGTLGCIGMLDADTSNWYEAFRSVPSGSYVQVEVV